LGRLVSDQPLNGEVALVSPLLRALAERLAAAPPADRPPLVEGFSLGLANPTAFVREIALADRDGPPPDAAPARETKRLTAHLGDLATCQAAGRFVWPRWIVRGHFNLLSSDVKIGKTHLAIDLARRIFFGLAWPDNQPATFPEGAKTLWVCGDRHQDEVRDRAADFGLPPEAIQLNASPAEPYGGWDLDDPGVVAALRERVVAERPALVIIDTVWRATRRRLSREDEVNVLMDPLITLAQESDTAFLGLMHLSKDDETLGRRLEGLARAILKLSRPDPGQPDRRKLGVIGNFKEPPPLGVTIRDGGCDFDSTPPEELARNPGGRPPAKVSKAIAFIEAELKGGDRKGVELIDKWVGLGEYKSSIFDARRIMVDEGSLVVDVTSKPQIWCLRHRVEVGESENPPAL
jgi:hypothetical protein